MKHTRYDHSMGVMLLIRILGGSLEDQIAGLLHDISHTAFSHLVDYVLENEEEDYHESLYASTLRSSEILQVLERYGLNVEDFVELEKYPILEYPLPSLSADRIDYTLRDLFHLGTLTPNHIQWFLQGLLVHEGRIIARNQVFGAWFREMYRKLIQDYFNSEANIRSNQLMKQLLQECMQEGAVTKEDFLQDDFALMAQIESHKQFALDEWARQKASTMTAPLQFKQKKRWIDPEVLYQDQVLRLSEMENL